MGGQGMKMFIQLLIVFYIISHIVVTLVGCGCCYYCWCGCCCCCCGRCGMRTLDMHHCGMHICAADRSPWRICQRHYTRDMRLTCPPSLGETKGHHAVPVTVGTEAWNHTVANVTVRIVAWMVGIPGSTAVVVTQICEALRCDMTFATASVTGDWWWWCRCGVPQLCMNVRNTSVAMTVDNVPIVRSALPKLHVVCPPCSYRVRLVEPCDGGLVLKQLWCHVRMVVWIRYKWYVPRRQPGAEIMYFWLLLRQTDCLRRFATLLHRGRERWIADAWRGCSEEGIKVNELTSRDLSQQSRR